MQVASVSETYEQKGAEQVRVVAPRDSDEKRFCTFHGFFSAIGMFSGALLRFRSYCSKGDTINSS